ncbi:MAG TPA: uroporphyrinogen decarboxylase [Myxococcota bacterium]|nr:uroporphyrinogen decarboxylase [Myxococcota bacterium]
MDRPPVWLMRQAGRYLPEYRAVRKGVGFLEMCADVERATTVSLQPIDLVGAEAVILFQDIFTPIPAMGVELDFAPGPTIAKPIREAGQIEALEVPDPRRSVPFVFEILGRLRAEVADREIPVLGFAGAPFTLAAYLIEGGGSKSFSVAKAMLQRQPEAVEQLLEKLTVLTIDYLRAQIEAGAEAVQLFDTWAGLLDPEAYARWVHPTHQRIARALSETGAPFILYVHDGCHVIDLIADSGASVISLDWRVELGEVARRHGARVSLQGNLDPCWLHGSREEIFERVRRLAEAAAPARGHVLNLGHGCLPDTPVEGVRAFTDAARALGA